MNRARRAIVASRVALASPSAAAACGRQPRAAGDDQPAPPGPPTIDVVRVVEQPLDVTLSMPGELEPYEIGRDLPEGHGIREDDPRRSRIARARRRGAGGARSAGARWRSAPKRSRSCRRAEAQLAVARSKADADASTYDKLKAASATPGVVAGNDLVARAEGRRGRPESGRSGAAERRSGAAGAAVDHARWRAICR